jgi:fibronectin type 3 domain-containing protein
MRRAALRRAGLAVLACAALLASGCGTTLDVDRARRWLDAPPGPELPELGDVAGYALERSEAREGPYGFVVALAGRSATAYLDEGPSRWPGADDADRESLEDGETLFYRVRAFDSEGRLSASVSQVVAATTAPPPNPPKDLRSFSHQPRQVPLSWEASPDPQVAGYVIERSPTSRGPFTRIAEVKGRHNTVHLDQGLGDLRVFHYRIAAVNTAGGKGEPSPPVRAVTKPEPLPPLGLAVTEQKLGSNQLFWEPNVERDLTGYRLSRRRADARASEVVIELPSDATRALDPAVGADETVTYSLVAVDSDGLESDETELEVTSVGYELTAEAEAQGVVLRWNPRKDEGWLGGRVYLIGLRAQELGFGPDGRFVHAEAAPGKRYRYAVALERADGVQAPLSTEVEIRVPEVAD